MAAQLGCHYSTKEVAECAPAFGETSEHGRLGSRPSNKASQLFRWRLLPSVCQPVKLSEAQRQETGQACAVMRWLREEPAELCPGLSLTVS